MPRSSIFAVYLLFTLLACGNAEQDKIDVPAPEENRYAFQDRIIWQQPGVVLEAMGDLEEKVVADIGAGEGFFAQQLVPLVDRVIAIEINPQLVTYLNDTLRQRLLVPKLRPRLEARLATPTDPKLLEKEVDFILMVNTFYEIENKEKYLTKLLPALKEAGRIVIVDWKKKNTSLGPEQGKRVALFELENILANSGYQILRSDDTSLEYQYIVVAQKALE